MKEKPKVEITNLQTGHRINEALLDDVLVYAMNEEGIGGGVSLAVVDSEEITELNRRFLGREEPTDVLAFPMEDGESDLFGEVVICADVAARESQSRGIGFEGELALYAVHGLLHLSGYDDRTPEEEKRMRKREKEILGHFGITVS